MYCCYIIKICSEITSGRVLDGELLYTKILGVKLFAFAYTDCFVKISLKSTGGDPEALGLTYHQGPTFKLLQTWLIRLRIIKANFCQPRFPICQIDIPSYSTTKCNSVAGQATNIERVVNLHRCQFRIHFIHPA